MKKVKIDWLKVAAILLIIFAALVFVWGIELLVELASFAIKSFSK